MQTRISVSAPPEVGPVHPENVSAGTFFYGHWTGDTEDHLFYRGQSTLEATTAPIEYLIEYVDGAEVMVRSWRRPPNGLPVFNTISKYREVRELDIRVKL